jgi:hypothetical protein
MVDDWLWEALNLDREDVARRGRFFSSYAKVAQQRQIQSLIEMSAAGEFEGPGLLAFEEPPGLTEDDGILEPLDTRISRPLWVEAAAEGDALREAAMANLLLDVDAGFDALRQAAQAYGHANPPYALFLASLTGADPGPIAERAAEMLDTDTEARLPTTLLPAQQVYLLIVMGAFSERVRGPSDLAARLGDHPAATSGASFGTTGAPIADWWALASGLLAGNQSTKGSRDWLRVSFTRLGIAHGEQLRRAQLDGHHWGALHSPIDLVDLDLAGTIALVNRGLRVHDSSLDGDDFAQLPPLAQVSIRVGLELGTNMGQAEPAW